MNNVFGDIFRVCFSESIVGGGGGGGGSVGSKVFFGSFRDILLR